MENFTIVANVPVEQPPITERAVSHLQAAGAVLLHKLGNVATESLNVLDLAVYDSSHGTHMLRQYQARKVAAKATAFAAQYELG